MWWRRPAEPDHVEQHIAVLAKTARLEMDLGMVSYQDTLSQMHELISQLDESRKASRSAEDALIDQLRRHLSHLESVVHHREDEYDRLQERFCKMQEELARLRTSLK